MLFVDYLMLNIFSEKTLNASFISLMILIFITNLDKFKIKTNILLYLTVMIVATFSLFQMSIKLNSEDIQRLIDRGYVNKDLFNNITSTIEDNKNFDYQSGLTYSIIKKAIDDERDKEKKKKKVDEINKKKLDSEKQFKQIKTEVIKKNNWS